MMKRYSRAILLAGLCAFGVLGATGCQDKPNAPADVASSMLMGTDSIQILDVRFVSMGDAGAGVISGAQLSYEIVKLKLTNNFSTGLQPQASNFILLSTQGDKYGGVDSGASALIGISNDYTTMKRDDTRVFTIGFRTFGQVQGQVAYEY